MQTKTQKYDANKNAELTCKQKLRNKGQTKKRKEMMDASIRQQTEKFTNPAYPNFYKTGL